MIPLKDDTTRRTLPVATLLLVALNLAAFVRLLLLPAAAREEWVLRLALIPADLVRAASPRADALAWNALTLLTSMFVHAGWLHLLGNMLYLWIFGPNIEEAVGHGRFVAFYLLSGLAAAAAQIAAAPASRIPMVGASGAIAGVLGAYLVLHPTARVSTLLFLVVWARVVELPALILLGLWLLIQLIQAAPSGAGGVAWFAHLGGFLAGLVLVVPFRRKRSKDALY